MMDNRTAEVLEASIKHWEENVAAETPDDANTGSTACALCDMFYKSSILATCAGCPVNELTEKPFCRNTPHLDAAISLDRWEASPNSPNHKSQFLNASQKEVEFLKSLRDPS